MKMPVLEEMKGYVYVFVYIRINYFIEVLPYKLNNTPSSLLLFSTEVEIAYNILPSIARRPEL